MDLHGHKDLVRLKENVHKASGDKIGSPKKVNWKKILNVSPKKVKDIFFVFFADTLLYCPRIKLNGHISLV